MPVKQLASSGPFFGGNYQGLSTDAKPTENLGDLSTFWETDTDCRYVWNGSTWILDTIFIKNFKLELARGNIPGMSFIHKFGEAPDIDIADGFVHIWDGVDGTLGTGKITEYTFSTTADIDSLSSSDDSDTQEIEVQGLDTNYDLTIQTITLTGRTRKALDTNLIRVFRMKNVGSADLSGTLYCYVNGAITNGVPGTAADVRAIIKGDHNQTLMSIYTIPNGKTGYMCSWYASTVRKKNQISDVEIKARRFGEVFQIKHRAMIDAGGTSHIQYFFDVPEILLAKTDIIMLADSSKDDGAIASGFDIILVDD